MATAIKDRAHPIPLGPDFSTGTRLAFGWTVAATDNMPPPITSHLSPLTDHTAPSNLPYPDTRREPGQLLFLKIRNLHFALFNGERTAGMKTATGRRIDR